MNEYTRLADTIFPNIKETLEDIEKKYPPRNISSSAEVTRFAPSPTGFLHTGSLCTAMIAKKVAKDSKGIFYLRIEDTDQKREVVGSDEQVTKELIKFNVVPDEGYFSEVLEKGKYGPYKQSKREYIYQVIVKHMISQGTAYPCFCSFEELDAIRKIQEAKKERTGYYGEYATCRNLTPGEAISRVQAGIPYVIRFKSKGNHMEHFAIHDEVKGDLNLSQNDMDIVLLKSDGLPTYHFAHLVDDHFMHTTIVIRGEEWLASLPIHIELFDTLGFKRVKYAHLPVIMKIDETGKKRKLSKRKDPEAAVSFFLEAGYPVEALMDYLLTIANSNYEQWMLANPGVSSDEFKFSFAHTASDGALFDLDKIKNISKDNLARKSGEQLTEYAYKWSKEYSKDLKEIIDRDYNYFVKIMSIEKDKENPRKDYENYGEIFDKVKFFYDDYYEEIYNKGLDLRSDFSHELIKKVIANFIEHSDMKLKEEDWFEVCKENAKQIGFAPNKKELKNNPDIYKYMIADYMEIIRVIITGRKNSPNLYYCLNIIGLPRILERLEKVAGNL